VKGGFDVAECEVVFVYQGDLESRIQRIKESD
jgi:hypothetical protein